MARKSAKPTSKPPQDLAAIDAFNELGPPVLLEGEDETAYKRLLAKISAAVAPKDVIEEFWVRDIVDLVWEAMRLRRLKANLLLSSTASGVEALLLPMVGDVEARRLAGRWLRQDEEACGIVDHLFAKAGLPEDAILAQTLSERLDDVERIDRMLANAEARRHLVLREIDRRRSAVATRLRAAAEAIEEGEYSEIAPPEIASAEAA